MGFWAWFWIWTALIVGSLGFYAYLGLDLWQRSKPILKQLEALLAKLEKLSAAIDDKPESLRPTSALEREAEEVFADRRRVLKHKAKRKDARERRLIAALNAIKVDERKFTNETTL